MPDIAMCTSNCPLSKTCYRHPDSGTKPSEFWQSWSSFDPIDCEYYWRKTTDE